MNLTHLKDDFRPFETYQHQPYSTYQVSQSGNPKEVQAMIVATSFGIYFALLGLIAYEDLFRNKDKHVFKA